MAFNKQERLEIWKGILAKAEARLASVETDYPCADAGLLQRLKNNERDSVKTASEFVKFYSE